MKPERHRHGNEKWFKMWPNSACPGCGATYKPKQDTGKAKK